MNALIIFLSVIAFAFIIIDPSRAEPASKQNTYRTDTTAKLTEDDDDVI